MMNRSDHVPHSSSSTAETPPGPAATQDVDTPVEVPATLDRLYRRFFGARRQDEDRRWAERAVATLWADGVPQNADKPADNDVWLAQAKAALRARVDLSDQRVDQLIADARAQAEDSEHSLQERLGSPRLFARKVGPEPGVKPRREMLLYSVIAVGFIISLTTNLRSGELGGNSLSLLFGLWGVCAAFLLFNAAWRWRREIKAARD